MDDAKTIPLRNLPSVTSVLESATALTARFGHAAVTDAVRAVLGEARRAVRDGAAPPEAEAVALAALARLEAEDRSSLRPLFNLTGTVLHTNLGRADRDRGRIRGRPDRA
jgi:L-seryl-tRNA(Ser) seleniumtransferase